jgi:hypothetical protein
MKSFIFQALEATCSEFAHAQDTTVGLLFGCCYLNALFTAVTSAYQLAVSNVTLLE